MASRTIPIGGVTVFEEADTKPDEEREDVYSPPHLLGTEESQGTGSDQGLEHQEPNENSMFVTVGGVTSFEEADTKPDEEMEDVFPWPNLVGTEESRWTGSDQRLEHQEPNENSRIVTVGGVTSFEEADTKPDEKREDVFPWPNLVGTCTEKSRGTGSDQSLMPQEPIENITEGDIHLSPSIAKELNPALANNTSFNVGPQLRYFILIFLILLIFYDVLQESPPSNNIRGQTSNHSFQPHEEPFNDSSANPFVGPDFPPTEMDEKSIRRGVDVQLANDTFQDQRCEVQSCSNETKQPVPDNNLHSVNETANESYLASMSRHEPRQHDYQNVVHSVNHTADTCVIDMEPTIDEATEDEVTMHNIQPVSDHNLHPVNGTANESYLASMLRQEPRQHDYQNVFHSERHTADTCVIDMEPTIDEATEDEVTMHNIQPVSDHNLHPVNGTAKESYLASMLRQELRQHNNQNVIHIDHDADEARSTKVEDCRTRPPENQPQGIPHGGGIWIPACWRYHHGGWIWIPGWSYCLYKTCSLDQFLNGLLQIFRFPPLLQLLKQLAGRFPMSYLHLWEAVVLCKEGRFPEAKFCLVPYSDMLSTEGERVMPLIESQLCHWFITCCERCQTSSKGQLQNDISFWEFNQSTGLQEAFRSYFIRQGECSQEGGKGINITTDRDGY